jgi:hypothetical protein
LVVSSVSSRSGSRSTPGLEQGGAAVEDLDGGLGGLQHRAPVLLHPRLLGQARDGLLQRLEVGEDQLGGDRLDVGGGVDAAVDVHDVGIVEHAHDLADRVGLADVGQELVAQPRALGRALDDAGDVDEGHDRGDDLRRRVDAGQLVQTRVGQRHHADVGLDRGERVVRGEHVVAGQGVEQGRLADVREPDDPQGQ